MQGQEVGQEVQLLVKINRDLAKRFKKRLIDDDLTYKSWLESRIREYLKEKAHASRTVR